MASPSRCPANDDAGRAIALYCDLMARAAIDGISPRPGRRASISARRKRRSSRSCRGGRAASGEGGPPSCFPRPRGAADDLMKLAGMSPEIVKKLNDAGVFHYWQIAASASRTQAAGRGLGCTAGSTRTREGSAPASKRDGARVARLTPGASLSHPRADDERRVCGHRPRTRMRHCAARGSSYRSSTAPRFSWKR
jgi:hypothetical protein